jgi:hypothetical protein
MKLKDKTEVQILNLDRLLSFIVKMFSLLIRSSISFSTEGLSKVPRICRRVVLPAPEAPTIDTISPCLI